MSMNRKNYENAFEAQLAEWKADLEVLRAKAQRAGVEARIEYDRSLEALERKHAEATASLQRLRAATEDAWEGLKEESERIWSALKTVFQQPAHKD